MPKNGEITQWGWPNLEELLQCPVCLEPAGGIVEQCRHGHHVCGNCKPQLDSCPLCKCSFEGTRNFVVEELVRHYHIIKNTMMLSNLVDETNPKKRKVRLNAKAPVFTPKFSSSSSRSSTPKCTKGLYPCRVGDCDSKLHLSRLLNHVRSFHSDVLTEGALDFTDSYNQIWEIQYRPRKAITKQVFVSFVSGIGLLYVTVEILRSGDLIVFAQMATKYRVAQNFLASFEFFTNVATYSYNTRLISVRDNPESILQKRLCYTINKNQMRDMCINKKFQLKMRVSPYNNIDSSLVTRPDIEQINLVAAKRASLVLEEKDKQLIKEMEVQEHNNKPAQKKKNNKKQGPSQVRIQNSNAEVGEQSRIRNTDADEIMRRLLEMESTLQSLTSNVQSVTRDTMTNIRNNNERNRQSATSATGENGPVPPPNVIRVETVAGRRRNHRGRRQRTQQTDSNADRLSNYIF